MKTIKLSFLEALEIKRFTIFIFLFLATLCHGQRGVRIGYIDTEYILQNIDEYQAAQNQLNAKAQEWKSQIDKRLAALETLKKQLNNERVLLTDELIKEREEEHQIVENEIIGYQQKRFGPEGDLMIQKSQLMQPLQDQIFTAVQEIATTKKYDFIFDKSADVVMLYSADRYDISEQVLRTINRASKREQPQSRKERKAAEEEETIVEIKSERDERQKLIDERNAKREELLAKRKADLEAKRQARRDEIEAKKQKIKEEREKARLKKTKENTVTENQLEEVEVKNEDKTVLNDGEARKLELEEKKRKIKQEREKARGLKVNERSLPETEKNTIENLELNKVPLEKSKKESAKISDGKENSSELEETKPLSDREARKKALEEKKKRILAERKSKLEAIKRKRDSIKNNRK